MSTPQTRAIGHDRLGSATIDTDPRIARSRSAVADAVIALLVEGGPQAVTIDAIVARSGVAKSTIYRHWDTRDDVLVDVLTTSKPALPDPGPDVPTAEALLQILDVVVEMATNPESAHIISALVSLRVQLDAVGRVEQEMTSEQLATIDAVLGRGVEDGTIRPGYDIRQASAHLVGPLVFALLTGALPADRELARATVRVFLDAYGTGDRGPAEPTAS